MKQTCEVCKRFIKGAEGAKVYHMSCLMKVILPLDKRPKSGIMKEQKGKVK